MADRPIHPDLHGHCLCKSVEYTVTNHEEPFFIAPFDVVACHCDNCRRSAGAPFQVFLPNVPVARVQFREKVPGAYKTYSSSEEAERGFCGECGTTLSFRVKRLTSVSLTVCSMENPNDFVPRDEIFGIQRLRWIERLFSSGILNVWERWRHTPDRKLMNQQHVIADHSSSRT
ncbi:hypothetical protein M427DRAFT_354591 [Gonapodya prolifera JEL478]|uniref:CENP-V/GFA domain-containing protein n=1 Tax=Gonapodya prolifera (strain JEL478) TaxID=1344416 RepID=A0A139ABA2_GONPJ|nr:hypothetical protein M427DRAFT_354591 [Gonapodya prolifera JEL478]|eukprot:KXS14102.1 hypothetical protein M427DRAFT_354591 [Gonapodya prolifera JEL478]